MKLIQDWLVDSTDITLRMQAVLLSAIRGCDGQSRTDPSKSVLWALRADILNRADPEYDISNPKGFMGYVLTLESDSRTFLRSLDHYPFHFVMHIAHAAHILAEFHVEMERRSYWRWLYNGIVEACHLNAESVGQLCIRMADTEEQRRHLLEVLPR